MSTIPSTQYVDACTNGYLPTEKGLTIQRYFTDGITHPYDNIEWELRTAEITDAEGKIIFKQENTQFPKSWSQQATNIVAQKYFRGPLGSPEREFSLKHMIDRVADTIMQWGYRDGYFDKENALTFTLELKFILLNQMASLNSPVWFNIGVPNVRQQAHACYILDVEDDMDSILNWYVEEGKIFSNGSGSGVNLSKLRSKQEFLSGGGKPSGVLSFMSAADKSASVIKSGGRVRRSAKLVVLDIDHPDIEDFIWCKVKEEKKARALILAGYDSSLDGEVYQTISFQNANNSVSMQDEFLQAVEQDLEWSTRFRTTGEIAKTYKARDLFHQIAQAAWECGDPAPFFYDTINSWHTTPLEGPIRSGNPCMEHLRPSNEACNLAGMNLIKFLMKDQKTFDTESFCHTIDILVTAMDILVSNADYPTEKIKEQSHKFRTVGLGYNNLGGLLMVKGLPYDSEEGRNCAASITALMTGEAYLQSAKLAYILGEFPGYKENEDAMGEVILKHTGAVENLSHVGYDIPIVLAARTAWGSAVIVAREHGYRNAQVSLLQPGGTTSFAMDCATTGVEPEVSLVKYKKLSGGGQLKMANPLVEQALRNLDYTQNTIYWLTDYIAEMGSMEGCNQIDQRDMAVFDCAFPTKKGGRSIAWEGHVKMVAALQPFLSGGVSKTINMPSDSTVEDIERAYMMAWKMGLKSISIYRDGCKFQQPVTTQQEKTAITPMEPSSSPVERRRRLPDERPALTHKFGLSGSEGYVTVGLYEDGSPGEMFLKMAKEGSTIAGLVDTIATLTSLALQYGVPLNALVEKFSHVRFEPAGFTGNKDIPIAKSLVDYIFRWLGLKFLPAEQKAHLQAITKQTEIIEDIEGAQRLDYSGVVQTISSDAPLCSECGSLCIRSGSCYTCVQCGSSSGCG